VVVVGFVAVCAALTGFVAQSGYLAVDRITGDVADDWAITRAAFHGTDPYRTLLSIEVDEGVRSSGVASLADPSWWKAVGFRAPGAFLLLAPIAALPRDHVYRVVLLVSILVFGVIAAVAARVAERPNALIAAALAIPTLPVITSFEFATHSIFVTLFLLVAWARLRGGDDDVLAGVLIGLASTLKLYPLLLLVPLIAHSRRRAAIACALTFVALNAIGLAVFSGVTLGGAVRGLRAASDFWGTWGGNSSLAHMLYRRGVPLTAASLIAPAALLGVAVALCRRARSFDVAFVAALALAVTASTIAWPHYDLPLIAGAAWLWVHHRANPVARAGVIAFAVASLYGWLWTPSLHADVADVVLRGNLGFTGRVALIVACAVARA
jgi:alpha-1,2-mannosyltransferase